DTVDAFALSEVAAAAGDSLVVQRNALAQRADDGEVEVTSGNVLPEHSEIELAGDGEDAKGGAVEVGVGDEREDAELVDVEIGRYSREIREECVLLVGFPGKCAGGIDASFDEGLLGGTVFVGGDVSASAGLAEGDG